jgi:hypothetical protein
VFKCFNNFATHSGHKNEINLAGLEGKNAEKPVCTGLDFRFIAFFINQVPSIT